MILREQLSQTQMENLYPTWIEMQICIIKWINKVCGLQFPRSHIDQTFENDYNDSKTECKHNGS